MKTVPVASSLVRFGVFEADLRSGELTRNGRRVPLQERPFQVLALLLERPGELVTREELRQRLWPADVYVDFDQGLNNAVKKLRLALDDSPDNPRFVQTLARRGYRFIAPLDAAAGQAAALNRRRGAFMAAAVGAAVLLAVLWASRGRWLPPALPARSIVLAVLPFDNLSGDPAQEYLNDGLTEEMIMQVGRLHPVGLRVIGRTSSMLFKGKAKSVEQVGRRLGVDYILSGSVRRAGGRIRVTAELVRVRDQLQLWNRSYDRELRDVIDLQSEIARAIAAELPLGLGGNGRVRAAVSQPVETEAYESYLRGLYSWSRWTPAAQREAIEAFEKALAEDAGYAPPWVFLGSAITISAHMRSLPASEAMTRARAALSRALELDPASPEAHAHDGWLKLTYEWDFEGAGAAFERALALNPSLANAQEGLGLYLATQGRAEESVAAMQRARELDPLSVVVSADLCLVLHYARRYDEAIAQCHRALAMDPGSLPAHAFLKRLYSVQGKHAQAIEAAIKATSLTFRAEPWFGEWSKQLGSAQPTSGWEASRRQLIAWMLGAPSEAQMAYSIAEETPFSATGRMRSTRSRRHTTSAGITWPS